MLLKSHSSLSLLAIASTVLTVALDAVPVHAVTLNTSTGAWVNPVGGGTTIVYTSVGSESQILWGTPVAIGGSKSGLGVTGVGASGFGLNSQFLVGTLNHFNNPVFAPSVSAVDLQISLDFADIGGSPLSRSFTFNFGVDETSNSGTAAACLYLSIVPCSDKLAFVNTFASETFDIGGTDYTLKLLGFGNSPVPGGALLTDFISQEGGIGTAYLYGEITAAPRYEPVPEPVPESGTIAALSLLGLGILTQRRHRLQ